MPETDPHKILTAKTAEAAHQYAIKNFAAAADLYSEATELQSELNGEMALENADLLYAYGRCLYHVAVSKSDVLGGMVAGKRNGGGENRRKRKATAMEAGDDGAATVGESRSAGIGAKHKQHERSRQPDVEEEKTAGKPFFQISGDDEGWDDSDSEDELAGEPVDNEPAPEAAVDEEEDDFGTAYEILDVARVLLSRRIEAMTESQGTREANGEGEDPQRLWQAKERLADTHDLQAEISLENERFTDAVTDARASLALKEEIHPKDSNLVAEAHYKLSLALEFASFTKTKAAEGSSVEDGAIQVDESLRSEAAKHMEAAIESTKLRLEKESKTVSSLDGRSEEAKGRKKEIAEVHDMIREMEQRLEDLLNPAVPSQEANAASDGMLDSAGLKGILGAMLGASPEAQRTRIEEATREATDLTGMIRHKKRPVEEATSNGKRKVNGADDLSANCKKARVEDAPAS